jgi:Protein of unknown function (DUF3223)
MLGGRAFPSQKAVLAAVREVLNRVPLYKLLEGADLDLIRGLLRLHPECREKVAGGIGVRVQLNCIPGLSPQRGFHIVRSDGSTVDFSIYTPFRNETQRRWGDITGAARLAVQSTINDFKRARFNGGDTTPCELTGAVLSWDNAVVDHGPPWPFRRILNDWISPRGYPQLIDRGLYRELAASDAADFVPFHNARARLRVIDKVQNMRLGDRGRR